MAPPPKVIVKLVDRARRKPGKREIILDQLLEEHAAELNEAEVASQAVIEKRLKLLADKSLAQVAKVKEPSRKQVDRAAKSVEQLTAETYQDLGKDIIRLSEKAAKAQPKHVREALKAADVSFGADFGALSANQLRQAIETPMFGWNARKWIDWHSIRGGMRLEREIRSAFFLGESIDTVTRRLFYSERSDGSSLFTQERHELKMLARTAIQSAANAAAEATYENSRDVLSGMRIVATLDNRTCTQCGPLDGRLVKFGSKFPRPPFHPNCRCYLAPEVHADLLPGRNPRPPTWSQWITGEFAGLKPQAVKRRQLRVLGPTITNLIEDNRIAVSDLVTDRGKRRTAAQLVALSQTRSKARKAA